MGTPIQRTPVPSRAATGTATPVSSEEVATLTATSVISAVEIAETIVPTMAVTITPTATITSTVTITPTVTITSTATVTATVMTTRTLTPASSETTR